MTASQSPSPGWRDRSDPAHPRASRYYRSSKATFLTTDLVFAETMSLLTKRLGKPVAVPFGEALRSSPRVRIEEPSPEMRVAAWELFASQLDEEYDLVDCVSFAVMDAFGIGEALGFDRHFTQHGLRLVPE